VRRALLAVVLTLVASAPAAAATFAITNRDGAGEGLNDATAVAPVGGNPGTTRGAQRLRVLERATEIWGDLLESTETIRIDASFDPLTCQSNSAQLGFAGPSGLTAEFQGAPLANTWYPAALGDAVAGRDLAPGASDIQAMFNSNIDTGCFMGAPQGWYYGLDGAPPPGQRALLLVALHELAHGLGFILTTNLQTGAQPQGFDDVYSRLLEDHTTGKLFPQMSDGERLAALTRDGDLHWTGQRVRARSGILSEGRTGDHVHMYAPAMAQAGSSATHFDVTLTPNELMEPFFTADPTRQLTEALFADIGWTLQGEVPTATATATPSAPPSATLTRTPSASSTATPTLLPATATRTATAPATATASATRSPTPRPTTAPGDPGDADCDGRLRVADVLALVRAIGAGGEPACAGADADGDGDVDGDDLQRTLAALFD